MGEIKGIKDGTRGCAFNDRFNFESIEASTTKFGIGFAGLTVPCADRYNKITSNFTLSSSYSDDYENIDVSPIVFSVYSSLSDEYIHTVDEFGEIISSVLSTKNCGDNGSTPLPPRAAFSNSANCLKLNRTSSCETEPEEKCDVTMSPEPEPGIPPYSCSVGGNINCINPVTLVDGCSANISCELKTQGGGFSFFQVGYAPEQPEAWRQGKTNTSFVQKAEDVKDWDFWFKLAKQSADKKLTILQANQVQNCEGLTCGGRPEDCWSPWAGTLVADTEEEAIPIRATSQKWKTRVRKSDLNDAELQKYTIQVESKYYLEIPVLDSDPIRILVDEGIDTLSGNQNRGSIHEFTNEDFQSQIGQPIYGCLNIKRIDRI
jgi:hypothetical protein